MIRAAHDDDYLAFTSLFPELRVDDPVPTRQRWVDEIAPTTRVLEVEGEVLAYAWFQAFAAEGIVRHIVVAPRAQGRGLGRALLLDVARELRARGLSRWSLNVKPDNAPALALYRRLGFGEAYRSVSLRLDWTIVDTLPPGPSWSATALDPADDAAAEVEQGLPHGILATLRAQGGRELLAVRVDGRFRGVSVFFPAFPGTFPFRADDLSVARALLVAHRPGATDPHVYVVVEGQPALARALVDHGAAVRLEIVHLEGDVPPPTPA